MLDSTIIKIDDVPVLDRGGGVRTWPLVVRTRVPQAGFTTGMSVYPVGKGAPMQTPPATVTALWRVISDAMRSPDVEERLKGSLLIPVASAPVDAAAFVASERQRWRAILEAQTN